MRRFDLTSLIVGVLAIMVAVVAALLAGNHRVPWNGLAIAVPAVLVIVGVLGMISARGRT